MTGLTWHCGFYFVERYLRGRSSVRKYNQCETRRGGSRRSGSQKIRVMKGYCILRDPPGKVEVVFHFLGLTSFSAETIHAHINSRVPQYAIGPSLPVRPDPAAASCRLWKQSTHLLLLAEPLHLVNTVPLNFSSCKVGAAPIGFGAAHPGLNRLQFMRWTGSAVPVSWVVQIGPDFGHIFEAGGQPKSQQKNDNLWFSATRAALAWHEPNRQQLH